ncbi:MAG: endolytic transglycosylase MltG [Rhodoferax sp.]|nr:endolytic transglycosylase MltG [Rhodoferax sp.]
MVGIAGAGYLWLHQPLSLVTPTVDLSIEPGSSGREIAAAVVESGVAINPDLLYAWFRLSGLSRQIRAGSYELNRETTPRSLLDKLVRGEEALRSVTLVEGWTFRQVREALGKADQLKPDSKSLSADDIMQRLGKPGVPAEGHFFPDTYTYSKGSSDMALLLRAMHAMDKRLQAAWSQRDPKSPVKTPEDALILASIIEKETGAPADRTKIASVFSNRLAIGMRLQTDPTVIYGVGASFDGNLRKKDLQTDTPWNTYTRNGLPPTAIAMPGKAALLASVQPAPTRYLYFVARGDGSSHFSTTLDEHNRAVNRYQRGQ